MALQDDIKSLQYSSNGSPWVRISVANSDSLEYSLDGSPWNGVTDSGTTISGLKYYAGGTWVEKSLKYYNGSTWVAKSIKVVI